jgi:ABC-type glycerol-3-phosphate transport system permease component
MFLASVIPRYDLWARPLSFIPWSFTVKNFAEVLSPTHEIPIRTALVNSAVVASGTTITTLCLSSLAAYAFARLRFPRKQEILSSLLAVYMLPGMLFLIPIFIIMRELHLLDTFPSLIIPYSVWMIPFVTFILKAFFESIPEDIEDAALIDGCSRVSTIWRVVLPLSAPGLVAAAIYSFIGSWNEFLTPLVLTSRLVMITTALGLYTTTYQVEVGQLAAAGFLATLPVVLLTVVFQKYIVKGIVEGAVKG